MEEGEEGERGGRGGGEGRRVRGEEREGEREVIDGAVHHS